MDELINLYTSNKTKLRDYIKNLSLEELLTIFQEESKFNQFKYKEALLNFIIRFFENYETFITNKKILDMFLECNLEYLKISIIQFNKETKDKIVKYILENKINLLGPFLHICTFEYQCEFISRECISKELTLKIFNFLCVEAQNISLQVKNIRLSELQIDIKEFFKKCKKSILFNSKNGQYFTNNIISIDSYQIDNDFLEQLWNKYNIYDLRQIINDSIFFLDSSIIENYILEKELNSINNHYIYPINKMILIYNEYNKNKINNQYLIAEFEKLKNYIYSLYNNLIENKFDISLDSPNFILHIKRINDLILDNYIIDYLFNDNFYNVLLNIKELLTFYKKGHIKLSQKKISVYEKIINIDSLEYNEKLVLFNELRTLDIMTVFYDDMKEARKIRNESIKNNSLTYSDLEKNIDSNLRITYNWNVIYLTGQPFYGIVKSGHRAAIDDYPTGHSFSVVGPNNPYVYSSDEVNYLYDASLINTEQIVHVYPSDSYTCFKPYNGSLEPTDAINKLQMVEELDNNTQGYNEVLILEEGNQPFPINDRVPKLTKIAIYCVDNIRKKDLQQAKLEKLPIVLVNTKYYFQNYCRELSYFTDYKYYNEKNAIKLEFRRK